MVITEILQILFQATWEMFLGMVLSFLKVLPEFLEIKEILSSLTPTVTDIIAFYLGVPAALVSAIILTIKVLKRINYV